MNIYRSKTMIFAITMLFSYSVSSLHAQQFVHFDKPWWNSLDKDEQWDFIYGFTDCGNVASSGLNMMQYEDFIDARVTVDPNSVPTLIRLAPSRIKALKPTPGGEVWTEKHGFNDGDLWGDNASEGRAWVEGYMTCENRPVTVATANRYVRLMLQHYANPKRHLEKLADVLEPLLPKLSDVHQ